MGTTIKAVCGLGFIAAVVSGNLPLILGAGLCGLLALLIFR